MDERGSIPDIWDVSSSPPRPERHWGPPSFLFKV